MTLSACGSGGGDSATGDDAETETETETENSFEYTSPIGEYLGWDQGADFDEEAAQAQYEQQERDAQEAIAACMAAEGFEYLPVDYSAQEVAFEDEFGGLEWGSDEWTAKYGFGVSTQQFSQSQVGPDLVGHTWDDFGPGDDFTDPNQAYIDSLGPSEQDAYYEALWGSDEGIEWDESLSEEENQAIMDDYYENEYVPTGCETTAYEEIYNGGADQQQYEAFEAAFGDWWQQLDERMESHPDVIAYHADVRACVEEAGVEYLTDEDAWEYFQG